eukprot:CAMPEP_0118639910 /NCGR_PEP_ID=MMETSP0785-20121206/4475_1 /TAXON_ID=91992 /ORGANISM="Bolidomonas pacifica, Strain CCMP 1866" /LENGTH=98 /DNA_ID=CAMNT_0006531269 /DNA_START=562 /DNA_END=858 /DNA_ORIENTATION=-
MNPTDMQQSGLPDAKFVVPSIGSIIHVGEDMSWLRVDDELPSSPMILWFGKALDIIEIIKASLERSTLVVMSVSLVFVWWVIGGVEKGEDEVLEHDKC